MAKKKGEKGPGIAESFVGGLLFTMLLVVVVYSLPSWGRWRPIG